MTTAKKILTLALCLTCLTAGMTGCAKDKSSSDTKIAKSTSSQSESSDSEKIKELNDSWKTRFLTFWGRIYLIPQTVTAT